MPTLPEIDPAQIADPAVRQVVRHVLDVIARLHAAAERQRAANPRRRDDVARLPGGAAPPTLPAPRQPAGAAAAERERRAPRSPRPRREAAPIDRTQARAMDRAILPPDPAPVPPGVTGRIGPGVRTRAVTRAATDAVLAGVRHPEGPRHNHPADLGARRRVRKRDGSVGPRTAGGAQVWDTFPTLAATTAKLGGTRVASWVSSALTPDH
jgi:hypothetical protein